MPYNIEECKRCKNKGFDFKTGLICNLTNEKPEHIGSCVKFENNPEALANKPAYVSPYKSKYIDGHVNGWIRFANYIIDRIIVIILSILFTVVLIISGVGISNRIEEYLIIYSVIVFYYTLFEAAFGQSVGKFATGTIVVTDNGEKPSFSTILGRSFCRLIPFNAFSFLGEEASGWHDSITGTRVIEKSIYKKKTQKIQENLLDVNL